MRSHERLVQTTFSHDPTSPSWEVQALDSCDSCERSRCWERPGNLAPRHIPHLGPDMTWPSDTVRPWRRRLLWSRCRPDIPWVGEIRRDSERSLNSAWILAYFGRRQRSAPTKLGGGQLPRQLPSQLLARNQQHWQSRERGVFQSKPFRPRLKLHLPLVAWEQLLV